MELQSTGSLQCDVLKRTIRRRRRRRLTGVFPEINLYHNGLQTADSKT